MNKLILIAGASAAGKSRYAKHFGNAFPIPVISKDSVKEVMHDGLQFHATTVEQTQYYGACAYKLLFYFAECLMKSGVDLCLESSFTNQSKDVMLSLLRTYHYESLTVFLNAPLEILHQRFIQREKTEERHPGLSHGIYHDFETYEKVAAQQTEFDLGDKRLEVDVSDWDKVDYGTIDLKIEEFINIDRNERAVISY